MEDKNLSDVGLPENRASISTWYKWQSSRDGVVKVGIDSEVERQKSWSSQSSTGSESEYLMQCVSVNSVIEAPCDNKNDHKIIETLFNINQITKKSKNLKSCYLMF